MKDDDWRGRSSGDVQSGEWQSDEYTLTSMIYNMQCTIEITVKEGGWVNVTSHH